MPVHDWTLVDEGTFHAFHTLWISRMMGTLNAGLLPNGYYALAEQVAARVQTVDRPRRRHTTFTYRWRQPT
jgi:hypothetical protein